MKNNKFRAPIHSQEHQTLRRYWISERKNQGLSQRDLAAKLGVTRSLIGKIETGDRRLDLLEALDYAKVLNIDIDDFIHQLESLTRL